MRVQTFPSPVYFGKQLQTACSGGAGIGSFHREILLVLTFEFHDGNGRARRSYIDNIYSMRIIVIFLACFSTLHSSAGISYLMFVAKLLYF